MEGQKRSYTAMLQAAAASGTDKLGDEVQSMAKLFAASAAREDPQQRLRDRCAAQLLEAAARSIDSDAAKPKALLVDIGSGMGRDVGAWRAQADAAGLGADRLDIVGVELLGALNEKAAVEHPSCRFVTGDVAALPLDDSTVDGVHCSRLLIHSPDAAKAIDEMVRVLRPGGFGVFEEGDYGSNSCLTGDARTATVFRAVSDATMGKLANPHAARVAYTLLLARDDVESVVLESDSFCILDMEVLDPGLNFMQKNLDTLVAAGTITQEDADYYRERVRNAPHVGEPIIAAVMFKISFKKKQIREVANSA